MKTIQTSISVGESIRVAGIDMNVISVDHKYSFAKLQATDKSEMATINISVLEEINTIRYHSCILSAICKCHKFAIMQSG